jgi:hypothetical protein
VQQVMQLASHDVGTADGGVEDLLAEQDRYAAGAVVQDQLAGQACGDCAVDVVGTFDERDRGGEHGPGVWLGL